MEMEKHNAQRHTERAETALTLFENQIYVYRSNINHRIILPHPSILAHYVVVLFIVIIVPMYLCASVRESLRSRFALANNNNKWNFSEITTRHSPRAPDSQSHTFLDHRHRLQSNAPQTTNSDTYTRIHFCRIERERERERDFASC